MAPTSVPRPRKDEREALYGGSERLTSAEVQLRGQVRENAMVTVACVKISGYYLISSTTVGSWSDSEGCAKHTDHGLHVTV